MTPAYIAKLGLTTWKTIVKAEKIDGSLLETYGMTLAIFLIQDNLKKIWFFEETFLLANTNIEKGLKMSFLLLDNVDVKFLKLGKLTWRF